MRNDILKILANRAKNRLMNKSLRDTYSNASIKIINNNDDKFYNKVKEMDKFYNKVKEMLSEDKNITNPIKRLMDESKLIKMNSLQREKYLFETIVKYNSARERFLKEEV